MREMLASGAERVILSAMPNDLSIAAALGALLKERKQTLAVAESSAGGLISAALLAVPGASAYFLGGGVIYTQAARRGLLRVGDEAVKGIRSSSEPYAQLKAKTVRELLGATWGLAETGASGPTGNRYGDAAGHACIAVAGPVERVITVETGAAEVERHRQVAVTVAVDERDRHHAPGLVAGRAGVDQRERAEVGDVVHAAARRFLVRLQRVGLAVDVHVEGDVLRVLRIEPQRV